MRVLLCLLLSCAVLAQQPVIPLYSGEVPCVDAVAADASHYDAEIGEVVTAVRVPDLIYFSPVPRSASQEAVLVIPGGGYTIEAYDLEGTDIARYLSARGYHAFVLRHRLPQGIEGPCKDHVAQDDAQQGLLSVRRLADSLGYRADRVGVMGFSAGGHLAGSVSVHARMEDSLTTRPDFSILVYPVLIMSAADSGHAGSQAALLGQAPDPQRIRYYNLPTQVDSLTPPTILFHASDDTGVLPQNSLRYYEALIAHGVPADLRIYARGGHGFGSARELAAPVSGWLEEAVTWIRSRYPTP
ncbi:alpha/beta hydrolase [Neolewinella sp.]|uniref:alpha/beta hydrolase n=1 Tax=Neolewinella sp. TaxID=2993543 RepID=UPI003B51D8A5